MNEQQVVEELNKRGYYSALPAGWKAELFQTESEDTTVLVVDPNGNCYIFQPALCKVEGNTEFPNVPAKIDTVEEIDQCLEIGHGFGEPCDDRR